MSLFNHPMSSSIHLWPIVSLFTFVSSPTKLVIQSCNQMWQDSCAGEICTNDVHLQNISFILYQSVRPKYTDKTTNRVEDKL